MLKKGDILRTVSLFYFFEKKQTEYKKGDLFLVLEIKPSGSILLFSISHLKKTPYYIDFPSEYLEKIG